MAAAKAAYVCLILSVGLSIAKACVLLECLTPTADPPKYHFGGIHHWLIIFAIVVACVVGLVLLILLIWLACWCCYRCDTQSAPNVVRRVVLRRREYVPQRKVNFNVTPPPPPVVHQPSEKIVVIQPAPVTPQSLLLTVSENPNYTTASMSCGKGGSGIHCRLICTYEDQNSDIG